MGIGYAAERNPIHHEQREIQHDGSPAEPQGIAAKKISTKLRDLINTVDKTIEYLKGNGKMTTKDLFKGFDESQYEKEAKERWGGLPKYEQSQRRWSGYSAEQREAIKAEGKEITLRMVTTSVSVSPDDPDVQGAIGDYLEYINKYFYSCDIPSLRGLADMWAADARFSENYDCVREGGAEFVRDAVNIFCERNE